MEPLKTVTPLVAVEDPMAAICEELNAAPEKASEKYPPCPATLMIREGKYVLEIDPSVLAKFLHPMKEKAKKDKAGNELKLADGTSVMERPGGRTTYLAVKAITVNKREFTINANAFLR
jgi:hypothetical protein